jgi:hypothetical protein
MLFKCYFQISILILTLVITGQLPIIQISNTEIKPVDPETKRLESQATLKVVLVVYKHYCKYSNQFHQG